MFPSSFSPFANLCEVTRLESFNYLPSSETCIYPKVLFINLPEEEAFLQNLVKCCDNPLR